MTPLIVSDIVKEYKQSLVFTKSTFVNSIFDLKQIKNKQIESIRKWAFFSKKQE